MRYVIPTLVLLSLLTVREKDDDFINLLQIPDKRTGDNIIDAVVVDEEAVGVEGQGCGAKILYGEGALDRYLSRHDIKYLEVGACQKS